MKADITRRTFKADKHYSRTIQQQGRVPMDADWNEQVDIQSWRDTRDGLDVIGLAGTPKAPTGNAPGSGFQLVALSGVSNDVRILPGRMWVAGRLCENDAQTVAVLSFPSASVIALPTLRFDERLLRVGDYLEVDAPGVSAMIVKVSAVDTDHGTVTVGGVDVKTPFDGKGATVTRAVTIATQPDPPTAFGGSLTLPSPGVYLAYLDVFERHVTALDDPSIADSALGGPDTCTRGRTTWQVRTQLLGELGGTYDCNTPIAVASTGQLAARAAVAASDTPCQARPGSSYTRLENQLYRVEVHVGGALTNGTGSATFKWSRENGSVVQSWLGTPEANELQIGAPNRDDNLGFIADGWVELTDDEHELSGTPGVLVRVQSVEGDRLTVDLTTAPGGAIHFTDFHTNPRVRRWESSATQTAGDQPIARDSATNGGWIILEDGVQVQFADGNYVTGDYWLIPARTLAGDVEWPKSSDGVTPLSRPRNGTWHHFAPLGQLAYDPQKGLTVVADCRAQFPPLTNIWAGDVKFDNGNCEFDNQAKTVQQALDALCAERQNSCCAVMITPDEQDLQGIIDQHLKDWLVTRQKGGIHISFADGAYALGTAPLVFPNPSLQLDVSNFDLTVSGCGFESKLSAPQLETVLQFTGWRSVYVHDLSLQAGVAQFGGGTAIEGPPPPSYKHLGGALSFATCIDVRVERARIECASGPVRAATCITVNNAVSTVIASPATGPKTKSRNDALAAQRAADAKRLSAEYDRLALQVPTGADAAATTPSAAPAKTTKKTKKAAHPATKTADAATRTTAAREAAPKEATTNEAKALTPSEELAHEIAGHLKLTPPAAGAPSFFSPSTNVNPNLQMNASTNSAAQTTPRRSVRVTGCEFVVGYLQTGVLVVDTHRVHISDNRLTAATLTADQVTTLTSDPRYLARLGRLMISDVYIDGKVPAAGADLSTYGTVKANQHTLHFRSDKRILSIWQSMLSQASYARNEIAILFNEGAEPTTPPATRKRTMSRPDFPAGPAPTQPADLIRVRNEVARRLKQVARAILQRLSNPQGAPGPVEDKFVNLFGQWFNEHKQNFSSVAGQGFVVAGTYAEEVRIRDNSIDNALESIHVGFSHRDTYHRDQPDQGTRVQISGNSVRVTLPPDAFGERHGVFVGNSDSVTVESNHVVVTRVDNVRRFEAIRLFGYYGKLVRVVGNHSEQATASVRMTPLNLQDAEKSLWLVAENISYAGESGPTGVDVAAGVRTNFNIG